MYRAKVGKGGIKQPTNELLSLQRGLVSVTIRDFVLLYSYTICRTDFLSIVSLSSSFYTESIRSNLEPYSTIEICTVIIFDNVKIPKNNNESRKYRFYLYLRQILAIRLRDLFDHQEPER